jgi:phospholipid/cholesterol/gamma-HCH transport system permease protein
MKPSPTEAAVLSQPTSQELELSGFWTARGIGLIERQLETVRLESKTDAVADGTRIEALDTAGAWVLHKLLMRLRGGNVVVTVRGLRPRFAKLLDLVAQQTAAAAANPIPARIPPATSIERIGRGSEAVLSQAIALLAFVGENAHALAGCVRHPERLDRKSVV